MNASNVQPADQGICRDKIPDKGTLAIYSRTRSSNPNPLPQHAHRCTDAACGHLAPCVLIDTGYLLRRAPPLRDGVQAPCSNAVRATCKRNDARPYACERRCCALRLPLDRVPHRCCRALSRERPADTRHPMERTKQPVHRAGRIAHRSWRSAAAS